ncbi:hypothetical protein IGI37_001795 [Enterococcus sp. AZ194]|uniref:hypothetical protein n=1 Tax=Enterococcus sp. AZ194 TaxID=2774629 RepID=UPI003F2581C3
MLWVSSFLYNRSSGRKDIVPLEPLNTLTFFKGEKELDVNCQIFAIFLSEIYLYFGFKSRVITCFPIDLRYSDCHCVTLVYSNEYAKWICFDPSMNCYCTDVHNIPLNVKEIREFLILNKKIKSPMLPRRYSKSYLNYLAKNFIRFSSIQNNCFGGYEKNRQRIVYYLNPVLLNFKDKTDGKTKIINTQNDEEFWS